MKQTSPSTGKGNYLIVDDEENIREILGATIKPIANKVLQAESAEKALQLTLEENFDVIICDIKMPGMNGLEFLHKVKQEQPEIKFLMITAFGTMDTVINAMRFGASDFITKPFDNARMRETAQRLFREKATRQEPIHEPALSPKIEGIIGQSPLFQQCLNTAMKAAASDSNILILGESGTGKELLARAIHDNSSRAKMPFIPINCGAIPENLLESELFGYEKGAFTGALERKPGKFVLAQKGTIFLDEIGEMPIQMQVKLLRVLQDHLIEPVGATSTIPVDFRLLAATNRNLEEEIKAGAFREDLYYRLNIIPITLPTLQQRCQDIILLADYFLGKFNARYSTQYSLTPENGTPLLSYSWPGNIRELENIMERAVVLGDKTDLNIMLPQAASSSSQEESSSFKSSKREHEKEKIIQALEQNRWNKTKTAEALGISRRSLLYKVKEFNIV